MILAKLKVKIKQKGIFENLMVDQNYTGWYRYIPTSEEWGELYTENNIKSLNLLENQYLLIYEKNEDENTFINAYCNEDGRLRKVSKGSIPLNKKRKEDSRSIYPRNEEQICAIDLLLDDSKTVKLITGKFGSGKTMLMVGAALYLLRNSHYEKIIWVRNNVDVKNTKDLGALPGDVNEKLLPFLGPFIDHVGVVETESMVNNGSLTVEPLQFLRGRNFENSIIMCSEAENLTKEHIQLIVARAAENSIVMFDADTKQRDKEVFESSKGVEMMIDRLKGNPLFGYVQLVKGERSETASLADLLD